MTFESPILPLIKSYLEHVSIAISYFRKMGIRGNILRAWRKSAIPTWTDTDTDSGPAIPQRGFLDEQQVITYSFHGIGCCVEFGTLVVDFDFGPNGRFDGFDAWRLHLFAESMPQYNQFANVDCVQTHLTELFNSGLIRKFDDVVGSHLYFFVESETSLDRDAFQKSEQSDARKSPVGRDFKS